MWIDAARTRLWGRYTRFIPDLRLIAVPVYSPTVDRFWTTYPQKRNAVSNFRSFFYMLALATINPHIWGWRFLNYLIYFRTIGLIVHRRWQFSTVLSELSTVIFDCWNVLSEQTPLNMGLGWDISDS